LGRKVRATARVKRTQTSGELGGISLGRKKGERKQEGGAGGCRTKTSLRLLKTQREKYKKKKRGGRGQKK